MKNLSIVAILALSLMVIGCDSSSSGGDSDGANSSISSGGSSSSDGNIGTVERLQVFDINDVAGYTFTSIEAEFGSYSIKTINSVSFDCDLSHKQTLVFKTDGHTETIISRGTDLSFQGESINWNGIDEEGENQSNSLSMIDYDYIVTSESCFADYGSCENGIYLKTIEKTSECTNTETKTPNDAVGNFNVVGNWYGCGGEGCFDLTYYDNYTFTQITTSGGYSVVQDGNWEYGDHPHGGDAVLNYDVFASFGEVGDYPFKIVDNDTMINDVTPPVTLKRQ